MMYSFTNVIVLETNMYEKNRKYYYYNNYDITCFLII